VDGIKGKNMNDKTTIKPGYQTSELYVTCGASIAAFVTALASPDLTGKITTGIIAALAVVGYIYSRHQQKVSASNAQSV
jgi:hypothetical protein